MTERNSDQLFAGDTVVVLGMHKSGTTLIAETLHRSGIAMIGAETSGGYDDGNKMERAETRALNMQLLSDDETRSLRLVRPLGSGTATPDHEEPASALVAPQVGALWGF
jgi:hypothetical protein